MIILCLSKDDLYFSCDSEFGCVDLPSTSSKVELSSLSQPTNGKYFFLLLFLISEMRSFVRK